jgi:hypothetical protein
VLPASERRAGDKHAADSPRFNAAPCDRNPCARLDSARRGLNRPKGVTGALGAGASRACRRHGTSSSLPPGLPHAGRSGDVADLDGGRNLHGDPCPAAVPCRAVPRCEDRPCRVLNRSTPCGSPRASPHRASRRSLNRSAFRRCAASHRHQHSGARSGREEAGRGPTCQGPRSGAPASGRTLATQKVPPVALRSRRNSAGTMWVKAAITG